MSLTFLPITLNDVGTLMPIENDCHSHPWSEKTFKSCIGDRYFGHYLKDKEHIIGFYIGEYILGEATLMDICISPSYQGNGYGKHILNFFTNEAKSLGAEKLHLEVRAKNISALMMYINDGYAEIARRTGYYPSAIGYEDAIVMTKSI
ncbi:MULTISPECIES: ribosomal protein S18-alanine N-acetyltransferase [Thalassotalea]|uniref:[Ribosomal protein bS18]-alanine N-acetyltransferase n=1 Tax=Thalassotalea castellviae TaxID=3075612 RepID=A0ABU3A3A8_9GAMM|nr:ribosomal protein S18-alanine N-acetyltransferase [Thalassotalea sp. W431]MDT0604660.1 ribosomal protein S18-alanine N-acetyltransferase [Thalassotalea sp. W431]